MPCFTFRFLLLALLFSVPSFGADTVRIYFPVAISQLQSPAVKTIDSAFYYGLLSRQSRLKIYGYADFRGSSASNKTLSQNRAQATKNYLMQQGIPADFITLVTGEGEIAATKTTEITGIPAHRRVDIIVLKGNEMQTSIPSKAAVMGVPSTENRPLKTLIQNAVAGEALRLGKIFFQSGLAILREESEPELQALLQVMQENKGLYIRLEGHVCCIDASRFTDALDEQTGRYELSANRARMVAAFLTKQGIEPERVTHVGYGKKFPVYAQERRPEEADANRRVEVRILRK